MKKNPNHKPRLLRFVSKSAALFLSLLCMNAQGQISEITDIPGWKHVRTADGHDLAWNDSFYHYRSAEGTSMFSLWVPDGDEPIRGLIINGHGGGIGDNRRFSREQSFRHFAAQHRFGVVGLHHYSGRAMFHQGGSDFLNALDALAALGRHPELKHLPFIIFGSSNGAGTAYALANYAPERTIAFGMNVGRMATPSRPTGGTLEVPGMTIVGPEDPFFAQPEVSERIKVESARARGARWAIVVEAGKGHEDGFSIDLFIPFFEACIDLRLPKEADARKGPVTLKTIPLENGWLADHATWTDSVTRIVPYPSFEGDTSRASWLPNEATAHAYRAVGTFSAPVEIVVEGMPRIASPFNQPMDFMSVGGNLIPAGEPLTLSAAIPSDMEWSQVEFYDGAHLLGSRQREEGNPSLEVTADPRGRAHLSLTTIVTDTKGTQFTSRPFHILIQANNNLNHPGDFNPTSTSGPRLTFERSISWGLPNPEIIRKDPMCLGAQRLTHDQEARFAAASADTSSIGERWATIESPDELELIGRRPIPDRVIRPAFAPEDAKVIARAAYGEKGLYFLFTISDNEWVGPKSPEDLLRSDVVDLLIAGHSWETYRTHPPAHGFVNASWLIPWDAHQIQVSAGAEGLPTQYRHAYADPFEFRMFTLPTADSAQQFHGLRFRIEEVSDNLRRMEWFLPWEILGTPPEQPTAGRRHAFYLAYFDRDAEGDKEIRPTHLTNPWTLEAQTGSWPDAWMDLVLLP